MSTDALACPGMEYLQHLREHLWYRRDYGQASVMVGAGFSRNAERLKSTTPDFPLWNQLASKIAADLQPVTNASGQKRANAPSGDEALRLASEYEATYGRTALDDRLLGSIPDAEYYPGHLHRLLLSLPWSDVFTTNYDTLLERTLPDVYERKYDLVVTVADIPNRMKPRIVKLHGSFPSHRPFIVTEEDYRTYPTQSAPFINLVQQSMMENTLCLLGFSGDDPNFLSWLGWVHDNLGSATPPVYLCGVLDLPITRRRLLEKRGVLPVDLGPLFPASSWPDANNRHAKATEWLLLSLFEGEPPQAKSWPHPSGRRRYPASEGLPELLPGPPELPAPGKIRPDPDDLSLDGLQQLAVVWRETRLRYPGWVVTPQEHRKSVWDYTDAWIDPVLKSAGDASPPTDLALLFELNWRMEATLQPIFDEWAERMIPIIERYNPYPEVVTLDQAIITPHHSEWSDLDWKAIADHWVQLSFAIVRQARESQSGERFWTWMNRLAAVKKRYAEWDLRWSYEECLYHLFRLDAESVKGALSNWPDGGGDPFWEVRRASLLAEIGELEEARVAAATALDDIRHQITLYALDFETLSREAWAMVLLHSTESIFEQTWRSAREENRRRWRELEVHRCTPWSEVRELESHLAYAPGSGTPAETVTASFDPGFETRTYQSGGSEIETLRPALSMLRLFEEGGLPMTHGDTTFCHRAVVEAAKRIYHVSPGWSTVAFLRIADAKALNGWFDRVRVACMPAERVSWLFEQLIASLTQGTKQLVDSSGSITIPSLSFARRQTTVAADLLSRLAFRLSEVQLADALEMSLQLYRLPVFRQKAILHGAVGKLMKRVLYAVPESLLRQKLETLVQLPLADEEHFEVATANWWPEPFDYIGSVQLTNPPADVSANWASAIDKLTSAAQTGTSELRQRAVVRLAKLHWMGALTDGQKRAFRKALWARTDPHSGLPIETTLPAPAFLRLAEPDLDTVKGLVRRWLLDADFPEIVKRGQTSDGKATKSVSSSAPSDAYIEDLISVTIPHVLGPPSDSDRTDCIVWTPEEAATLLRSAIGWWDREKGELSTAQGLQFFGLSRRVREGLSRLPDVLSLVVFPRLTGPDKQLRSEALRLLTELGGAGIPAESAWPMALPLDRELSDEVAMKLRVGLGAIEENRVRASIQGTIRWMYGHETSALPAPPSDLLNEIISRIIYRKQPALVTALLYMEETIRLLPRSLDDDRIGNLCIALDYLIVDTAIPGEEERRNLQHATASVPVPQRPRLRAQAAKLAYTLHENLRVQDAKIPDALIRWQQACTNDPLPEVRRAWPK